MAKTDVDFTKLLEILNSAVNSSNKTWCMLWKCCDSNKPLLKGWRVERETDEVQDVHCTCEHELNKGNNEDEKIVLKIDGVIEKAQTARKMCSPEVKKQATTLQRKLAGKLQAGNFVQSKSPSAQERPNKLKYEVKLDGQDNAIKIGENNPCNSNKTVKVRKRPGIFQTTYQRDFGNMSVSQKFNFGSSSQGYSRNTKKELHVNSTQDSAHSSREEGHALKSQKSMCVANRLLNHVASYINFSECSNQDISSAVKSHDSAGCALHSPAIQKSKTVRLEEAIDILGVPSELVKVLKTYHKYVLKSEQCVETETQKAKHEKFEFINTLERSNQTYWSSESNAQISDAFVACLSVFKEASSKGKNCLDVEDQLGFLDSALRKLNISVANEARSNKHTAISMPNEYHRTEEKDWALAGIWNENCRSFFAGLKNIMIIRYQDYKECLKLQENIHDIQLLQFQIQILQILTNDIFPEMSNMDGDDASFPAVYRTCSALCDIVKLRQPVLIVSGIVEHDSSC